MELSRECALLAAGANESGEFQILFDLKWAKARRGELFI